MCVCSLSYPAWKAHAEYYLVIQDLSSYTMFYPHYLINGTTYGKGGGGTLLNIKCVFSFFQHRPS